MGRMIKIMVLVLVLNVACTGVFAAEGSDIGPDSCSELYLETVTDDTETVHDAASETTFGEPESDELPEITSAETEAETAAEPRISILAESDRMADNITINIVGNGRAERHENRFIYTPADGCELLSITADVKIMQYEAGEEIPETELLTDCIPGSATLTYIFVPMYGVDTTESDAAEETSGGDENVVFDGVWDPASETIH